MNNILEKQQGDSLDYPLAPVRCELILAYQVQKQQCC